MTIRDLTFESRARPWLVRFFRVRVKAAYGPEMPSLDDLAGPPAEGYDSIVRFARDEGGRPTGWFVKQDSQFTPPLLILSRFYEIEAATAWVALNEARERFSGELFAQELPHPPEPIEAEVVG
jgi:hypothetical protein